MMIIFIGLLKDNMLCVKHNNFFIPKTEICRNWKNDSSPVLVSKNPKPLKIQDSDLQYISGLLLLYGF